MYHEIDTILTVRFFKVTVRHVSEKGQVPFLGNMAQGSFGSESTSVNHLIIVMASHVPIPYTF